MCEPALVSADPIVTSLGDYQQVFQSCISFHNPYILYILSVVSFNLRSILCLHQAHVYSSESGGCAAFLSNYDTKSFARVLFNNRHYNLPPWSISILPDCRNAVFNTAKVRPLENHSSIT